MISTHIVDSGEVRAASSHRRPDIQGLRAIAVIVVIAFHAGFPMPGGFIGVDVFFVISGFVITSLLYREWASSHRIRVFQFFKRRFFRLTPALAVLVSVTVVISIFILSPFGTQQSAAITGTGAMLFLANVAIAFNSGDYFSPNAAHNPLLNTWSLSVEEQFYILFPLILFLAWRFGKHHGRSQLFAFVTIALLAIISFGIALMASLGWSPSPGAALVGFYSPVTRAWEFAAGALLFLVTNRAMQKRQLLSMILSMVGAILLIVSVFSISEKTPFPGLWTLLPVTATLLLIWSGEIGYGPINAVLCSKPLSYVGDRSYSLYLWHWPLIVFAAILWPENGWVILGALALSLPISWASYQYVEQPLRHRTGIRRSHLIGIVVLFVAPPIALSQLLGFGARNDWGSDRITEARVTSEEIRQLFRGECVDDASIGGNNRRAAEDCILNPDASGAPIFLVGDSNSIIYSEVLLLVAEELNRPLYISASALCPFIDIYRKSDRGVNSDKACREYYETTLNYITSQGEGTVVIAESSGYWYESNLEIESGSTHFNLRVNEPSQVLKSGLRSTISSLEQAGLSVFLLTPNFQFFENVSAERCSNIGLLQSSCPSSVPQSTAEPMQFQAKNDVISVANETRSPYIDVSEIQCPQEICAPTSAGLPVYMDSSHMSPKLLTKLEAQFLDKFSRLREK